MNVSSAAVFNISSILACSLSELDDVLSEQDIPSVDWIGRPLVEVLEQSEDGEPRTPSQASAFNLDMLNQHPL